jgi:hypothetical protein
VNYGNCGAFLLELLCGEYIRADFFQTHLFLPTALLSRDNTRANWRNLRARLKNNGVASLKRLHYYSFLQQTLAAIKICGRELVFFVVGDQRARQKIKISVCKRVGELFIHSFASGESE